MVRQTARENRDSLAVLVFHSSLLNLGAGQSACPFVLVMTREEKLRFYHSTAWRKMSAYILKRDHYECQECRKQLQSGTWRAINRATLVHHIIPYEDDPSRGLDPDNLEAICVRCHNHVHGRDAKHLIQHQFAKKKYTTEEKW